MRRANVSSNVSWGLAMALGLSFLTSRAWADDKEDVGKGMKAWATALLAGDDKELKAHSIGDETDMARWEQMSKMVRAFKKLGEAAEAKYGEKGATLARLFKAPDYEAMQKESTIVVNGDDATVTDKQNKVMKMKKEGGEWKVVLASMTNAEASKMDPKQVAAMAAAVSSTADEIKEGKYKSYLEAMRAVGQKLAAAGAGGGARRPDGAAAPPSK